MSRKWTGTEVPKQKNEIDDTKEKPVKTKPDKTINPSLQNTKPTD